MKKKLLVIFLIIFVLSLCLAGCSAIQSTLTTPDNVQINGTIVSWNSVDGASKYVVIINGREYETTRTQYDLEHANLSFGEYSIQVKAIGDGYVKLSSEPSEAIVYKYTDSSVIAPPTLEDVSDSEVADKLFEYGLGYGVNALTATDAVSGVRLSAFFAEDAFTNENLASYELGYAKASVIERTSIKDEITAINSQLCYGMDASVNYAGMFTAGFSTKYGLDNASNSEKHINQYYYTMNHYLTGKNYQIKDFTTDRKFYDKISEDALIDLQEVREGTLTASEFMNRYGSHLKMAVSYGGMVEINYATYSKTQLDTTSIGEELSADLKAGFSFGSFGTNVGGSTNTKLGEKYTENTTLRLSNINATVRGGTSIPLNTFASFEAGYSSWVESMSNPENYRIVDVATGGLVPVWYYLPEEYNDVSAILSDYFYAQAAEKGNALVEKMTPPEDKSEIYTISTTPKNCNDNNGYNVADPTSDKIAKAEIDPDMVDIIIGGSVKEASSYSIVNDLSLGLKVLQSENNIRDIDVEGSGVYKANISDDTYSGAIKNTSVTNTRVGKGILYVMVTYTDYTTTSGYVNNLFSGTAKGTYIDVLSETKITIDQTKKIKNVRIVVAYEIQGWYKDGFGWFDYDTVTNWVIDETINFI